MFPMASLAEACVFRLQGRPEQAGFFGRASCRLSQAFDEGRALLLDPQMVGDGVPQRRDGKARAVDLLGGQASQMRADRFLRNVHSVAHGFAARKLARRAAACHCGHAPPAYKRDVADYVVLNADENAHEVAALFVANETTSWRY